MVCYQVAPYQVGYTEEGKIMEIASLLTVYEWLSGIGGVLQLGLFLLRRTNNLLMVLGVLLDAIGLAGMSFGFILQGENMFAAGSLITIILDVAFVLYIIYKDEHPEKFNPASK